MRYLLIIWMMAFLCGCAGKSTDNEVLQIDLNAEHSSIRLNLKVIADVTYIKLASNTDLLVRSRALVCNENYILTKGGETKEGDGGRFSYTAMHLPVVRNSEGYILNELSSDTIYQYSYVS